jgi:hypothetical protein
MAARGGEIGVVREEWNYHSRKTRKTLPRGGSAGRIVWGRTSRINSYQYEYTPIVSTRRGDEDVIILLSKDRNPRVVRAGAGRPSRRVPLSDP